MPTDDTTTYSTHPRYSRPHGQRRRPPGPGPAAVSDGDYATAATISPGGDRGAAAATPATSPVPLRHLETRPPIRRRAADQAQEPPMRLRQLRPQPTTLAASSARRPEQAAEASPRRLADTSNWTRWANWDQETADRTPPPRQLRRKRPTRPTRPPADADDPALYGHAAAGEDQPPQPGRRRHLRRGRTSLPDTPQWTIPRS